MDKDKIYEQIRKQMVLSEEPEEINTVYNFYFRRMCLNERSFYSYSCQIKNKGIKFMNVSSFIEFTDEMKKNVREKKNGDNLFIPSLNFSMENALIQSHQKIGKNDYQLDPLDCYFYDYFCKALRGFVSPPVHFYTIDWEVFKKISVDDCKMSLMNQVEGLDDCQEIFFQNEFYGYHSGGYIYIKENLLIVVRPCVSFLSVSEVIDKIMYAFFLFPELNSVRIITHSGEKVQIQIQQTGVRQLVSDCLDFYSKQIN